LALRALEKRESLYAEFVAEINRLMLDAANSEGGDAVAANFAGMVALSARIDLLAPRPIADIATKIGKLVVQTPSRQNGSEFNSHLERMREERWNFLKLCKQDLAVLSGQSS